MNAAQSIKQTALSAADVVDTTGHTVVPLIRSPLDGALLMASRGFKVFRLRPGLKDPLAAGIHEGTTDPAKIRTWAAEKPKINFGVATGGDLAVSDIDIKQHGIDAALRDIRYAAGLFGEPATLVVGTPSGGLHAYYRVSRPAGQRPIAKCIDIRATGGYVVAPGSIFEGRPYIILCDAPLADMPAYMAQQLSKSGEKQMRDPNETFTPQDDDPKAVEHAIAILADDPGAGEGERNNQLFRMAGRLKDIGLSEDKTLALLTTHWCQKCKPAYDDEDEIEKTVASCFKNGRNAPGCLVDDVEDLTPVDGYVDLAAEAKRRAELAKAKRNWAPVAKGQVATPAIISATPFLLDDPTKIPPRDFVHGRHLVRKFVSATIAPGGLGKSSLEIVEGLEVATGRALLTDKAPRRGRVWMWNGEEPYDELQRRIGAACKHYRIAPSDLDGWFFVDSGRTTPLVVATEARGGLTIAEPLVEALVAELVNRQIDVFKVDPFVACHQVSENDNTKIEAVVRTWMGVAEAANCAVALVHHSRKTGGLETTAEDARGASALVNKARSARVLNAMNEEQGEKAGVDNRRRYFRVDDGKQNLFLPSEKCRWYRLESVRLGNATAELPEDDIGVVTGWKWPEAHEGLPTDALQRVQRAMAGKKCRSNAQAKDWAGITIAEALGLALEAKRHKAQVTELIRSWISTRHLEEYKDLDDTRQERTYIRIGSGRSMAKEHEFEPIGDLKATGQ